MNKILSFYPFFTAIITIIATTAICFFNMYMLARHRKSYFTVIINISSLFTLSFLVFHMMGSAVFALSLSKIYLQISHVSLLFMLSCIIIGLIVIIIWGKTRTYKNMSTNILNALSSINDIVFVVDVDGNISHINHPIKYNSLFGKIENVNNLTHFMELNCCANWKYSKGIDLIEDTATCQVSFNNSKTHYIFKLTPIIISNGSPLGYTAVLEDISVIKASEALLQERNHYLTAANERLSNYVRVAGALEAEKERLAILEHVQETLICHIEKILLTIGRNKQNCFDDYTYSTFMKNLATQLREVYNTVRNSVNKIAGKDV